MTVFTPSFLESGIFNFIWQKQKRNKCPHTHSQQNANIFYICQCFVLTSVGGQLQWSEHFMWPIKESEEGDEDIGMALAGFIFLPWKILKLKNKGLFSGRGQHWVNEKMLTYTSLPYSGFDLLNQCPLRTAQDWWHCAEKNLQVAKLAMKQKTFDLYRLVTGLARGAENWIYRIVSWMLQNWWRSVEKCTEFLFCVCSLTLVWTWPKPRIYCSGLYGHGNVSAMIKEREEGMVMMWQQKGIGIGKQCLNNRGS